MSAYLTHTELSLLAADGTRVVVEAGDYVEAVDVFGERIDARRRAEWLATMRLGLERDPPRRRRPDELDAHPRAHPRRARADGLRARRRPPCRGRRLTRGAFGPAKLRILRVRLTQ